MRGTPFGPFGSHQAGPSMSAVPLEVSQSGTPPTVRPRTHRATRNESGMSK